MLSDLQLRPHPLPQAKERGVGEPGEIDLLTGIDSTMARQIRGTATSTMRLVVPKIAIRLRS